MPTYKDDPIPLRERAQQIAHDCVSSQRVWSLVIMSIGTAIVYSKSAQADRQGFLGGLQIGTLVLGSSIVLSGIALMMLAQKRIGLPKWWLLVRAIGFGGGAQGFATWILGTKHPLHIMGCIPIGWTGSYVFHTLMTWSVEHETGKILNEEGEEMLGAG